MSSEAITQNDLREILSRTVGSVPSEYKKLLWTNPSLSSGCSAFDLTFANEYDAYEIIFSMDNGGNLFLPSVLAVAGNSPCGADFTHSSGGRYYRSVTLNGATLSFTTGYYNGSANVNACVPYKIYGIKYERVAPPQVDALEWRLAGSATSTTHIDLPTNWNELLIYSVDTGYLQSYQFTVVRSVLDLVTNNRPLVGGASQSSATYWISVNVSETQVWLGVATANGSTDRKASVTTRVYYR